MVWAVPLAQSETSQSTFVELSAHLQKSELIEAMQPLLNAAQAGEEDDDRADKNMETLESFRTARLDCTKACSDDERTSCQEKAMGLLKQMGADTTGIHEDDTLFAALGQEVARTKGYLINCQSKREEACHGKEEKPTDLGESAVQTISSLADLVEMAHSQQETEDKEDRIQVDETEVKAGKATAQAEVAHANHEKDIVSASNRRTTRDLVDELKLVNADTFSCWKQAHACRGGSFFTVETALPIPSTPETIKELQEEASAAELEDERRAEDLIARREDEATAAQKMLDHEEEAAAEEAAVRSLPDYLNTPEGKETTEIKAEKERLAPGAEAAEERTAVKLALKIAKKKYDPKGYREEEALDAAKEKYSEQDGESKVYLPGQKVPPVNSIYHLPNNAVVVATVTHPTLIKGK